MENWLTRGLSFFFCLISYNPDAGNIPLPFPDTFGLGPMETAAKYLANCCDNPSKQSACSDPREIRAPGELCRGRHSCCIIIFHSSLTTKRKERSACRGSSSLKPRYLAPLSHTVFLRALHYRAQWVGFSVFSWNFKCQRWERLTN